MCMAIFHSFPPFFRHNIATYSRAMERNLQLDEGFTCNCGCSYCAVGRQCLDYLFAVPEGPVSTSLQSTDPSSTTSTFLPASSSAAFQAAGFPPPSLAAFPAECSSAGFQPVDPLSINALHADSSPAGFPSSPHPSSHGLHSGITTSPAAAGSPVTAPTADTGPPPDPNTSISEGQAIMVESLTYTPSNRYECLFCDLSFQKPGFLNRHIDS
ncbi:hypothetical protein V8C42DRAFT_337641 [Trichoderma barbatum]